MKKICLLSILMLIGQLSFGQSAKDILEKVAAKLTNKSGVTASFKMESEKMGTTTGTIAVKGKKFQASTPQAITWFDGKTQWTYLKSNDEVNVSTPTPQQLQAINPYTFIYIYKQGYALSKTEKGDNYHVRLKTNDKKRQIQEMVVVCNKKSLVPSVIRMKRGNAWTTFTISKLKTTSIPDSKFRFNPKDYPHAEVIDLR